LSSFDHPIVSSSKITQLGYDAVTRASIPPLEVNSPVI
jgi:hypothetical protein